jgi:hypothetical protein
MDTGPGTFLSEILLFRFDNSTKKIFLTRNAISITLGDVSRDRFRVVLASLLPADV